MRYNMTTNKINIHFIILEKCVTVANISLSFCGYTNEMTLVISINDQILYDLFKVLAYYFHYCTYTQLIRIPRLLCIFHAYFIFKVHAWIYNNKHKKYATFHICTKYKFIFFSVLKFTTLRYEYYYVEYVCLF